MNETQLTSKIKIHIKSRGGYVDKIFGGGYQASGIPDLMCCYKGLYVAIEVKSPTGKGRASDIQKLRVRAIRASGGIAFFADSVEDVDIILTSIDSDDIEELDYRKDRKYFGKEYYETNI